MKATRIYTGDDGDSYFEDINIELKDHGEIGMLSDGIKAKEVIFRETGGDYDFDFHNAPQRQFIILLDGEIEITTSRDQRRRFKSGDILFVEDTDGKGHRTRSIDGNKRRSIFITV